MLSEKDGMKLNSNQKPSTTCKETLPPEPQLGNVEYKFKLTNPSKQRFEHLVTQMKWRLQEGQGEAIYEIGVLDTGALAGLSPAEMTASLQTLRDIASRLSATTTVMNETRLDDDKTVAKVSVRQIRDRMCAIEVRIAVLGNADAGKSTLIGVITYGHLDNGRGGARLNMFRHLHEVETGRTSSISHEILGFNSNGEAINYNVFTSSEEICDASNKLVAFLDLAGHRKYISTTIRGFSGYSPQYALIVISSTAGVTNMTQEHLSLVLAFKVKFFIVITKTDIAPPDDTINSVRSLIKKASGIRRVSRVIENIDDVAYIERSNQIMDDAVPIFLVSCVTGEGIKLLLKFLFILPPGISSTDRETLEQELSEFQIDENFRAGDFSQIVGGLLTKGIITEGMEMKVGPHKDGLFTKITVQSIQCNRVSRQILRAGQSGSLRLNKYIEGLRNGMFLLNQKNNMTTGCLYFQATIFVIFHATAIYPGYQATVHIGNIRQTAIMVGFFSSNCIRTNERDSVLFKFFKHPELVRVGQKIFFIEGKSKGVGEVSQVFPLEPA